jgi:hypothetical protein
MLGRLAVLSRHPDPEQAGDLRVESQVLVGMLARIDSDPCGASGPGPMARRRSDLARSEGLFVESLARYRHADATRRAMASLIGLAFRAERRDDQAEAARRYREALDVAVDTDDISGVTSAAEGLAHVAVASGRGARGATLLAGAQTRRAAAGSPRGRSQPVDVDEAIGIVQASLAAPGSAPPGPRVKP